MKFWALGFWTLRLGILILKSAVWIFENWRFDFKIWALRMWNWKLGNENFWIDNLGFGVVLKDLFRRFVLWRFIQEICPLKICLGDSFEDLFRRFVLLWRCVYEDLFRRFFLWRFIQEIFLLKIGSGDFSFEEANFLCQWKKKW